MEQVGTTKIHTYTTTTLSPTPSPISSSENQHDHDEEDRTNIHSLDSFVNVHGNHDDDITDGLDYQEQDSETDPTAQYLREDDDDDDVDRTLATVYAQDEDGREAHRSSDGSSGLSAHGSSSQEGDDDRFEGDKGHEGGGDVVLEFDEVERRSLVASYEQMGREGDENDISFNEGAEDDEATEESGRGGDDKVEGGDERRESTRVIMSRIAARLGRQPEDVLPYTLQLEKEWLLTRDQLRTLTDDVFQRLQFPLGLIFALKEELGITEGDVPNMLKYKVLKKQIELKQRLTASPGAERKETGGPGRKRKRLTVADWREKVEKLAQDTKHVPNPFRVTSIFQVECFCCGYAVNMNKPGQLYYLRRHVEGVRPDIRISNHTKNYRRWQRQYQEGLQDMDELPPLPREPKRQRTRINAEEREEEEEGGEDEGEGEGEGEEEELERGEVSGVEEEKHPGGGEISPPASVSAGAYLGQVGDEGGVAERSRVTAADLERLVPHIPQHTTDQPLSDGLHHMLRHTGLALDNPQVFHNSIISSSPPLPPLSLHSSSSLSSPAGSFSSMVHASASPLPHLLAAHHFLSPVVFSPPQPQPQLQASVMMPSLMAQHPHPGHHHLTGEMLNSTTYALPPLQQPQHTQQHLQHQQHLQSPLSLLPHHRYSVHSSSSSSSSSLSEKDQSPL